MRALVVGGSASGKSAFAERLACTLSTSRTYAATMQARGPEAFERIRRHRQARSGLGFTTVACRGSVASLPGGDGVVLVDDLGNLVADALFSPGAPGGWHEVAQGILVQLLEVGDRYGHLVAVGCDVGRDGCDFGSGTEGWMCCLGSLQCGLADRFDLVVEVVCGLPTFVKGSWPCP